MSIQPGQTPFQQLQFGHAARDAAKPVDHDAIRERMAMPAAGLLITGLLSALVAVGGLIGGIVYAGNQREQIQRYWVRTLFEEEIVITSTSSKATKDLKKSQDSQANSAFALVIGGVTIASMVLCALYMAYVACGVMMKQLKNWKACRFICIMALIPGLSPLLVLGIPFGIIGLIRLNDPMARKAFMG